MDLSGSVHLTRTQLASLMALPRIESAKSRVAKELDIIQDTLKSAGNILRYFTDDSISDDTTFGEIIKTVFSTMSPEDMLLVSAHLVDGRFNRAEYQWQYTQDRWQPEEAVSGTRHRM